MTQILDQFGRPIQRSSLKEPQTARVTTLQNQYLTPMLSGLTPARLARVLQEADQGNLLDQHRLFSDMEERDAHLMAEMSKRKNAIVGLSWDIVPPRNPTSAEKAAAEWAKEMLEDAVDPCEDLLLSMMEAPGHGFAPVELEWRNEGGELLPAFHPRPQEWFRLSPNRDAIHLNDSTVEGAALRPFGWVMHTHGKAKTGYAGRMGLYRTLVWPFLYKAYALGDFAEFLETYGLPIIVGKYFAGASADEKASLMRAVTQLGHDARAIMPDDMQLEIQKITGGAGDSAHLSMMEWADRALSKAILGQTLSADTGKGGSGSYALGKVHNEVRHDIRRGDARQIAATLTRDLVYPMIALNRPGIEGLRRSPRFVFDLGEVADLELYANALPKLVGVGIDIPKNWAQQKLHIPAAQKGEALLTVSLQPAPVNHAGASAPLAALSASAPVTPSPVATEVDELDTATAAHRQQMLDQVKALVDSAESLEGLQVALVDAFGGLADERMVSVMGAAFALAELKGLSDAQGSR
ncbi:DUF935 domain-containing protein [Massilia sp. NR 4-1]|uniref:DUF935 domain-containing protein n=1 Tax=Massilia sp. NR 4-1 TaxID=1678028 RepID=UPI0006A2C9CC|nr:DUF935 domain-containing protein [Massilia sp. NR 4-1]AKU21884.1 hypothetical protein ACZ75_10810 [Massilia sp. NR 4-1]